MRTLFRPYESLSSGNAFGTYWLETLEMRSVRTGLRGWNFLVINCNNSVSDSDSGCQWFWNVATRAAAAAAGPEPAQPRNGCPALARGGLNTVSGADGRGDDQPGTGAEATGPAGPVAARAGRDPSPAPAWARH